MAYFNSRSANFDGKMRSVLYFICISLTWSAIQDTGKKPDKIQKKKRSDTQVSKEWSDN